MALNITLPTLYEHYTEGGIQAGLNADKPYFTLNDKNITIYSGAIHYFRVPRPYWRDRLRKLRAAGLNTVETYVPWNLHEPQPGYFDFGQAGTDMSEFLNLVEFLNTAKEEDLLAIIRPGPFICAEWEFGGFPSWLLRERDIKLRTSNDIYMKYVSRYFNVLLPILALLQFTRGGPIVAFQVENEYGSTRQPKIFTPDKKYLQQLRELMINNSIVELLVTSDSPTMSGTAGTLPGVFLQTANFGSDPEWEFGRLEQLQPKRPVMAMEFWGGWFDHWSEEHHTRDNMDFYNTYERILKYPASVNMYMFHGGTSFGFMNGGNLENGKTDNSGYQPDTTSYDYDAPITESGDYTDKYEYVSKLIKKYNPVPTRIPAAPNVTQKVAYLSQPIIGQLLLNEILDNVPTTFSSIRPISMEQLPINNMSGQSYGYIVYRKKYIDIPNNSTITIGGRICDSVVVMLNGVLFSKPLKVSSNLDGFGFWRWNNSKLDLGSISDSNATLDFIVENWGRTNFGHLEQFNQFKGIWQGGIFLNNKEILEWEIVPLEFKKSWIKNLTGWHVPATRRKVGPSLYKTILYISDVQDTYVDMRNWCKGIVIVNDFVLGRYSVIGPQQTLYLPAPFLKQGFNEIMVFEHYKPFNKIEFSDKPIYVTRSGKKKINQL